MGTKFTVLIIITSTAVLNILSLVSAGYKKRGEGIRTEDTTLLLK
jgi:hypothetical protein